MPPSSRKLIISLLAEQDYLSILHESIRSWGADQADEYRKSLDTTMAQLLSMPEMGRPVPYLLEDGYSFRARHHRLFYTFNDMSLTIHRILHERRDVTASLLSGEAE